METLPAHLQLRQGGQGERSRLLEFMVYTYQETYPHQTFPHLATTIDHYWSQQTPIWWVETPKAEAIACLWLGHAVDQGTGERYTHIFLLYVAPGYRRRGIGTVLMHQAEAWAREQGAPQIGLQVLTTNQSATAFYQALGYQPQALSLLKRLSASPRSKTSTPIVPPAIS